MAESDSREKSEGLFDGFTHRYSLSKTISFRLIPDERSQAFIDERGLVREDERLADDAFRAKNMMDGAHRAFIDRVLSESAPMFAEGFEEIAEVVEELAEADGEEEKARLRADIEEKKDSMRKAISSSLRSDDGFAGLFGVKMRAETMPSRLSDDPEAVAMFRGFDKLDGIFSKYDENRKLLYAAEGEAGSVAARIVDDNFPRHLANVEAWRRIVEEFPEVSENVVDELLPTLGSIPDMTPGGFVELLSQEGIERMNAFIGGVSPDEDRKVKLKGVNEFASEYGRKTQESVPRMSPLYKQVLSDRASSLSFLPQKIDSDSECFETVESLHDALFKDSVLSRAAAVLDSADAAASGVYVSSSRLSDLSGFLFGPRGKGFVDDSLAAAASGRWQEAFPFTHGLSAKKRERWRSKKNFSWAEVRLACELAGDSVSAASLGAAVRMHERLVEEAYAVVASRKKELEGSGRKLGQAPKAIAALKDFLDELLEALRIVRVFEGPAIMDRDAQFYAAYDAVTDAMSDISLVYNRVRDYATRRTYSTRKLQLHFGLTTLGAGWDANKEGSNGMIMLRKGDSYYIGIAHKPAKKLLKTIPVAADGEPYCEKMVYRQARSAMMALPKSYIVAKAFAARLEEERPDVLSIYKKSTFKRNLPNGKPNPGFKVEDVRTIVSWYKQCLAADENMRVFGFRFSPTENYESIQDFYREFDAQAYAVRFERVSEAFVEDMVERGDLYLFRLWSRHMGDGVHGTGSMYLHWWNEMFSEQNAETPVIKLLGGAELFFRPASIEEPVVHRKGSVLVNRTIVDPSSGEKTRIPEEVYQDIYRWQNGMIREESMSEEARLLWATGKVVAKEARFDIVKDRRFAEDRYLMNIAISINRLADKPPYPVVFNDLVLRRVAGDPDLRIVGINRGERNLVYATVVDRSGAIVEQRGFNLIDGFDWRSRLDEVEKRRKRARKDWQSQDRIKGIKEAYVSCAVREVVDMMLKHKAMVAIEDLSAGFVNRRAKIEKNVYQRFESQLVSKLGYLASKPAYVDPWEPGGACCGYQLALPPSSDRAARQNGFVLYANPWKTSAIDPATGFVCLFDLRKKNEQEAREFFFLFRSVRYNREKEWFEFAWDYSDFDDVRAKGLRTEWTACTHGSIRTLAVPCKEGATHYWKAKRIDLTAEIRSALEDAGVEYDDGGDLREELLTADAKSSVGRQLFESFRILMRMRYSAPYEEGLEEDYVLSPVAGKDGGFFDSRTADESMPQTGDANDAYHIALKGLQAVTEDVAKTKKGDYLYISSPDEKAERWLEFAQALAEKTS